jgi:uncharacterized protein YqgC (DUF456 family)
VTLVGVVVAILMIAGLIGAVVPLLPGAPLIVAGALIYAIATDFTPVGAGRLAILIALGVTAWALEHVAGALGARRAGGGRAAMVGALLGVLVGLTFAPIGLVVGPMAGAVLAQLLAGEELRRSIRVGVGTALGVLAGLASHAVLALMMVALFAWWVWRG